MDRRESLKQEFLEVWSEDRVRSMTLEEYTNLNKDDSFCYWLESTTTDLGSIWGGSAYKFGIYKRSDTVTPVDANHRKSDGEYAWYTKYGETRDEAFESVKNKILDIISFAKNDYLERIDRVDLGDAYKWKIAFLYSDYKIANIFKYKALKFLALANSFDNTRNQATSIYQKFLMGLKKNNEDYFSFTQKLWDSYESSQNHDSSAFSQQKELFVQYLNLYNLNPEIADELEILSEEVVSKGYFSKLIYECLTLPDAHQLNFEKPIADNWDNLYEHYFNFIIYQIKKNTGIDLSVCYGLVTFKDETEYHKFINNNYWNGKNKNSYPQYIKRFHIGSKLALYTTIGHNEILINAIGTVKKQSEDGEIIDVAWNDDFDSFPVNLNSQFGTLDFYEIEPEINENIINDIKNIFYKIKFMEPDRPALNQILYGPPGTGKTYKIIRDYIISESTKVEKVDDSKIYVDEKKNFWHLAPGESGYLWNEIKNQNYLGYEWCDIGLGNLKNLTRDTTDNFDMKTRFSRVKEGDYFCIISGKKFHGIARALHAYDFEKSEESNFDFQTIKVEWIKKFDKPELLNTYSTQSFSSTKGGKRWKSLIEALENQDIFFTAKRGEQVKKSVKNYAMVSFHQSFSYEDFIEGIKPDVENINEERKNGDLSYCIQDGVFKIACDKAANIAGYDDLVSCLEDTKENRISVFEDAPPFYLLIDEINRGNISAIFGELITLLEDDKRLGGEHELILDLPYSKKPFGIPPNLYIIGTMNTADRSVESLDTALRRRFSFTEIPPQPALLKNKVIDEIILEKLLETINDRIELLIDKDHKIGHSYFLNIKTLEELKHTFKNKVIPLLEEYFFGDFGKIGLVLGSEFITLKEEKEKVTFAHNFLEKYEEAQNLREKAVYQFKDSKDWKPTSFISIYNKP